MSIYTPSLMLLAATPGFFEALWGDLDSGQRFVLSLVAIGCSTGIVIVTIVTLSTAWATNRHQEREMELKRDLLDEGRSAEEIERILRPSDGFTRAMGGWFGCKKH